MMNEVIDTQHQYHPPSGVTACTAEDIKLRGLCFPDSLAAGVLGPV